MDDKAQLLINKDTKQTISFFRFVLFHQKEWTNDSIINTMRLCKDGLKFEDYGFLLNPLKVAINSNLDSKSSIGQLVEEVINLGKEETLNRLDAFNAL